MAPLEDDEGWNPFVYRQADASYCHLYQWRRIAERTYGRACSYLGASRDGELTGVLPLVWMPGRLAGHRLVSMSYLDLGGPLAVDSESLEALESAALDLVEQLGAHSVELREGARTATTIESDNETTRFRLLLALPETTEELWNLIGAKVRNQARKAEKSGLTTQRVAVGRLRDFYSVFARNMRDLGSPVHSLRFFSEIFEQFDLDQARLYLTTDSTGRCVGGAVGIAFRQELTVPWASSLRSERRHCPNHSLYWHILQDAIDTGATTFDFGRSSSGSGTFKFKRQWGATPVPLAWRLIDRNGARAADDTLSANRNAGLVSIWKHLPVPIANLLGPAVRGRLPH